MECSKDKIINLLSKSDITYVEIGKRVGLTRKRRPTHYRDDVTVDRVLDCYRKDLLVKDIAQTLNCAVTIVRKRLRVAGISKSTTLSRGTKLRWRIKNSAKVMASK